MTIELNADVGEGMEDEHLLPYLTSANVACGLHAGDPSVMDETVELAMTHGVHVGAHPGYPDRAHFGRVRMDLPADAVEKLVLFQIAALDGFVRSRGGTLTHVKPHGALYHAGAEFPDIARAIAEGVRRLRPSLVLVGPGGSLLMEAGREAGLSAATAILAIITVTSREWIEILTGWDPDHGDGSLEWAIVAVLGLAALASGVAARLEWLRARPVADS